MYLLRKLLSPFLFPLPVSLVFLLMGLALLWFTRRDKVGRVLATIGAFLLLILSFDAPARWLLQPLERAYKPVMVGAANDTDTTPRWIVVLGAGFTPDPRLPVATQLGPATLARVVEGVRLYKQLPGSRMVASGGAGFESGPEAVPMADVARMLGVAAEDVVLEQRSLDTEDQARYVSPIVGSSAFLLVTSASHMRRAMALFQKQGLHPIAAPADYDIKESAGFGPGQFHPKAENLRRAEEATYEYLGLAWARLRGAI